VTEKVECIVIGAGVVGLAIARTLALNGHEVLILEAEDRFGTQTSSRNSEVIHAGIYYPTNSLKARSCVRGRKLLYDYCLQRGIAHQTPGKLIVATDLNQLERLKGYLAQGKTNGVDDLELLSEEKLHQLEPAVSAVAALWSPSTGIVDSHGLMLSLLGDFESFGGTFVPGCRVRAFKPTPKGFELLIDDMPEPLTSKWLVNAAGHGAIPLATESIPGHLPKRYFAAGHYFSYSGKSPFRHLVYPVPDSDGLGVHATLDTGGQTKFGPDVEWSSHLSYSFDPDDTRKQYFTEQIRKYFPALNPDRLQADYVGVRPRISGPGEAAADFMMSGPDTHGIPGLVQLFGIESPGLTACLSLAEEVEASLKSD
jgi:L-2-hydroxyglutarate oxidase LhgO